MRRLEEQNQQLEQYIANSSIQTRHFFTLFLLVCTYHGIYFDVSIY